MSEDSTQFSQPKRHPEYYFDDGSIIFLVEDELFRVHRHFFVRESAVFRDMLSMPPAGNVPAEGLFHDNPIVLEGVKSLDFSRLLWVIYNPAYDNFTASAEEWTSVLYLADLWNFETIRELAIRKLGEFVLPPVDKLELCRRFRIDRDWASESYETLCARNAPLSFDEVVRVGLEYAVPITHAREQRIRNDLSRTREALRDADRGRRFVDLYLATD